VIEDPKPDLEQEKKHKAGMSWKITKIGVKKGGSSLLQKRSETLKSGGGANASRGGQQSGLSHSDRLL